MLVASQVFTSFSLSVSSQLTLAEQRCVFSSLWINDCSLDTVPTLHVLFLLVSEKSIDNHGHKHLQKVAVVVRSGIAFVILTRGV